MWIWVMRESCISKKDVISMLQHKLWLFLWNVVISISKPLRLHSTITYMAHLHEIALSYWKWVCLTYILRSMWLGVPPRTNSMKTSCVLKNWTTCSKYDNHYRLNSQHHRVNLYNHLTSKRIFTFMMNTVFVRAPKVTRNKATTFMWICYQSSTHHMFHSLGQVV
jgi:hypothetical protein